MQKYKEALIYLFLIIGMVYFLYTQIQPQFVKLFDLQNQIKTQTEVNNSLEQQVQVAKAKFEQQKKMNTLDELQKRIYEPNGTAIDADSTFTVILDDVIEMARKNHIKTHSIKSKLNPEDDIFIKGNSDVYSAYRMDMKIVTNYSDFENFIQDLYKYNYLININSIEIFPYVKNKRVLLINFTLTLYAKNIGNSDQPSEAPKQEEGNQNQDQAQAPNPQPVP